MACVSSLESLHHAFIRAFSKGFLSTDFILSSYLWVPGVLGGGDVQLLTSPSLLLWPPAPCLGISWWLRWSHLTADCLPNLHSYVKISLTLAFSAQPTFPSGWSLFSFVSFIFVSFYLSFFLSSLPPFFLSIAHLYFKHHYTFSHLHIFPHPDEIFKGKNHTSFTMVSVCLTHALCIESNAELTLHWFKHLCFCAVF